MEKFTFTEEIYSLILLLPKYRRNKAIKDVIKFGLYDVPPKNSKRYQPIMDNILKPIREEKAKRFIAQVNGQQGGRSKKTPEQKKIVVKNTTKNQPISKKNQLQSKLKANTKQNKPTKLEVSLFCIANGYNVSDYELNEIYRSIQSDNWRKEVLEQIK